MTTLKRLSLLALTLLCGCAAWQAGIHDPQIVQHAISESEPYKKIADAVYPHAGTVVTALIVPLLIWIGGYKKTKK